MPTALRAPTVQDLISAFEIALKDPAAAILLTTDAKTFAEERGWTFDVNGDTRIAKFESVQPEAFGAANELLKLTPEAERAAATTLLAKTLCAASRIVRWSAAQPGDPAVRC